MPGTGRVRGRIKVKRDQTCLGSADVEPTTRRQKRKLSLTSMDELFECPKPKRSKKLAVHRTPKRTLLANSMENSSTNLYLDDRPDWMSSDSDKNERETKAAANESSNAVSKCWINALPDEILLKILGYLPLGMLLHTIPVVCKKWETLALDWTLWKAVENLTIKNMVISTAKLRMLLRTIPRLKKLELILRNDTEELLHELIKSHQNLEVLKLDRCYRSTLQMSILSQTVTSILEFCPKLKTVMLTDTYFHSKAFYKCLARKFRNIERINVTCTTKSEMDVFMNNLKETVSEVEFQRVPMMGRAEGKQIYWGPILGLVVRPIPTSPFHRQYTHDNYPTYAF